MIEILNTFYTFNPYVSALLIFLFGFGSLLLVGVKTHTVKTVIFTNPAILIGDIFLLPFIGFIITSFTQKTPTTFYSNQEPLLHFTVAVVALLLTIVAAWKFKLINPWWLPHGIFYWFMSYIILNFFLTQGILFVTNTYDILLSVSLLLVIVFLFFHFYLGKKFPKTFPNP